MFGPIEGSRPSGHSNLIMHLARIDILRAFAIILVFAFHAQIVLFPGYRVLEFNTEGFLAVDGARSTVLNFIPSAFGWTGVHLFLIISGFLIHLGQLRSYDKGAPFSGRTFFSKRFWRIYPPYLLALLFFCFAINGGKYFSQPEKTADLISHLFVVHNLSDSSFFTINPAFWSIALEVQLYLIYPLLLVLRRKWGITNVMWISIGLAVLMKVLSTVLDPIKGGVAYSTSVLALWYVWCAGAMLAERFHTGRRILPSPRIAFWSSMLLFVLMTGSIYSQTTTQLTVPFAVFAWLAFFEWFLYIPSTEGHRKSIPFRALVLVGLCSYSIYLFHQPFLRGMTRFFGEYGFQPLAIMMKLVIPFAIVFMISYSLYLLVEQPSIAIGARLRGRRQRVGTPN